MKYRKSGKRMELLLLTGLLTGSAPFFAKAAEETDAAGLIGICRTSAQNAYEDSWGIKLTVRDVSAGGLTIVCKQSNGEISGTLETGSQYWLEQQTDGAWTALETGAGKLAWTDEALLIEKEEETSWQIDWSAAYGTLPEGSYRIGKSIQRTQEGEEEGEETTYYACFDLVSRQLEQRVEYSWDTGSVSLAWEEGWEYQIIEQSGSGNDGVGVCFRPCGEEGWVSLCYYEWFGVCGTGLEESSLTLDNGLTGIMGVYDGLPYWDFIHFDEPYRSYVAMTSKVDTWWEERETQVMELLNTAQLSSVSSTNEIE